jgi:hypothetical protein
MIHEKIALNSKQSIDSAETEFSSRSMRDNRRVSIISIEIFEDKSEDAKISYHVRNVGQLKDRLEKDENVSIKA